MADKVAEKLEAASIASSSASDLSSVNTPGGQPKKARVQKMRSLHIARA